MSLEGRFFLLAALLALLMSICVALSASNRDVAGGNGDKVCVCADKSLCLPLTTPQPDKEVFAFQVEQQNWVSYDWMRITTLALFGGFYPEAICVAHQHGVRIALAANIDTNDLSNSTAREQWVDSMVAQLVSTGADGINLDYESPVVAGSPEEVGLTLLVQSLAVKAKKAVPSAVITADVAWSPNNIDGRAYNYSAIIDACDYVIVMDYDTRSQVHSGPPCFAGPNAPVNSAVDGMGQYFKQFSSIPKSKYVLGQPWYGYTYPCINTTDITTEVCQIKSVPFRGVACSDAAGAEIDFSTLVQWARNGSMATTPLEVNASGGYAAFNYVLPNDPLHQVNRVYFDTPATLEVKYALAKEWGLRGVSMWNMDSASPDGKITKDGEAMWKALDAFLK